MSTTGLTRIHGPGRLTALFGTAFTLVLFLAPASGVPEAATQATGNTPAPSHASQPIPAWVESHWGTLIGTWITDNAAYMSDTERIEAYGLDWSWGLGKKSLIGRLYGLRGGKEVGTFWEFREFWHPGEGELITEQFGGNGAYGVGSSDRLPDGVLEMIQVFYNPAGSPPRRVGHHSILDGDVHTTRSFDVHATGKRTPRRTYVWKRQPVTSAG